ncbi:MAG: hypothetical protein JWQ02_100 [Capsulimonas sp.]|nr:hypothetical protein [Capsulimonas sp.]
MIFRIVLRGNYKSDTILYQWARRSGYSIIEAKIPWFYLGPFMLTTSRWQVVYRVVVEDEYGELQSGWVRCGSWLFGLQENVAEARWDR